MASQFQPQTPRRAPILGIVRNAESHEIDPRAWLSVHNAAYRNGAVEKVRGWTQRQETVEGVPSLIWPARFGSDALINLVATNRWLYKYSDDGREVSQINEVAFAAAEEERWQAAYELGFWYLTNFTDGLWKTGGTEIEAVATADPIIRGAFLAQFVHHLILANLAGSDNLGAHQFLGSGLKVADWDTADPASDATLDDIPDDATPFQGLRRLPSGLALYKETSINFASYVTLPDVYRIEERSPGIGLFAPYSLIDNGAAHVFMGAVKPSLPSNLYTFNGGDPVPFGDRIWLWWLAQMDAAARRAVFAFHDSAHKEIYFCFNRTTALVWNYEVDAFSTRDCPFTALGFLAAGGGHTPTFEELADTPMSEIGVLLPNFSWGDFALVGGKADGTLHAFNTADEDDALPMLLESGDTDFGDPYREKILRDVNVEVPEISGDNPLQLWIAGRRSLGDALVWDGPYDYDPDEAPGRIECFASDVWMRFKFTKVGGRCRLAGYQPLCRIRGER